MLPSKGYFKSLNCPYFDNGLCNRPHCHFRHTRKDKSADDIQQLEDADQSPQINDILCDGDSGEPNSDSSWAASQQSPSTSFSYKPTPIVELKKRHIPINTAPSVTLSSTSQKRRIEYDVKGVKKPKVEYIPEAVNSEPNSSNVHPTNVTNKIYRATKISDHSDRLLNGEDIDRNALLRDLEESEGEIDFDQVSKELNFLDEILKEYEKPVSIKKLIQESNFDDVGVQEKEEQEQIKNVSEVLGDKVINGTLKHCQISSQRNKKCLSSESDHIHLNETKKHKDSDQKVKSGHSDSKSKSVNNCSNPTEKSRQKGSSSSSTSCNKIENKNSSEHRRKSLDHHKSDGDKSKNKDDSTLQSSSKSTKTESSSESAFDKLLKNDSHKSSNSSKQSKREHGSSSTKSSVKESEHKNSSSKPTKKDSERGSSSNKSSAKESDRKSSSSKSSKMESDHHSRSSKSSKNESQESRIKRTHSTESQSSSKRAKENSKGDHKQGDSRKSSKYKDENRHRKESNEKRSTKEDRPQHSKESRIREKSDSENRKNRKRTHSVSESEESSDDDVEIISDKEESIIVIDSEEDSSTEKSLSKKRKVEYVESSPSPARSSGVPSPTFPTDVSDTSDLENNAQDDHTQTQPITVSNGPNSNKKTQDDALLLDHRVQSRVKNRVSLGTSWRPPSRKPVEIMTPAQRLLLFAKLREQEEKDNDSQSNAGRVKIGCVPNVKLLLQEKERLLKGSSNKNVHPKDRRSYSVGIKPQLAQKCLLEEKDIGPPRALPSKHPRNKGAEVYTRQALLEKLYKYQKQLLEPGRPLKEINDRSTQDELRIWLATNHDTYEKEMQNLIMRRRGEIPNFTLRYFTSIRPRESILFPPQLKIKPKNGQDETSTSHEDSLYSWILKYKLNDAQLESEGYPRKKIDPASGRMLAYINQASLNKWKKAQGVPPTGEFACANCSKFYSVDENGLSTRRGECSYHAKKTCLFTKDKSGLLEKKARCCGNELNNPCMSSEYHSTETRDLQNLEGFVETRKPRGEMPLEGWGIFALDCEMYWSTRGLELGRVTVVNAEQRTVYDTFVRPEFPVTDYSTRMSGITKENLASASKSLVDVQRDLMKIFNSQTILIGHSLENDLKVLQIIHGVVVDTAIVFKKGDYKQALKVLAGEILKEVIQNEEEGHDSAEDAVTCIKLMVQKIFQDAKALIRRAPPAPRCRYQVNNQTS